MKRLTRFVPLLVLVLLVILPYSTARVPFVFDGPLQSAGTLQLLALCLIFAGLAQSYDLLFGRTGLMSFGHALYVACGVYTSTILMNVLHWPLLAAGGGAVVVAAALAALLGRVALRTSGVAFAMVTLAFAQAGAVAVSRNPAGLTGGSDGMPLHSAGLPTFFVGVGNTVNLYWLALGYLVLVTVLLRRLAASRAGDTLLAIRDNELRAGVLGVDATRYKLGAFVLAAALAAGGGVVYALTVGGASPQVAATEFTLSLLIMVVLGGPASRWGAIGGAVLYVYLDHRLASLGTAAAGSGLPEWLGRLLSQPTLWLGGAFMLLVVLAPNGIAARLRGSTTPTTVDKVVTAAAHDMPATTPTN